VIGFVETITDRGVDAVEALAPNPSDLVDAFASTARVIGSGPALRRAGDDAWICWRRWREESERAARGLVRSGVRRGDTVALMLRNRPEFHIIDLGALMIGAIPFSIYNTSSPDQIRALLSDAGASIVVAESDFVDRVRAAAGEDVAVFSIDGRVEGAAPWGEVLARADAEVDLDALRAQIAPGDLATIIYTSGTTGPPKGVQLTHANLLWMARILPVWWRLTGTRQALLSYLPMAHVAERIFTHYVPIVWGWPVSCCEDPRMVAAALPSVEPTIFFAPPRFWEKLRAAALAGPLATPEAEAAIGRGVELVRAQQAGEPDRHGETKVHAALAPVRGALGLGRVCCAMISAASVPPPLVEWWRAVGVPLVEGYGLSEASAGVCFDDPASPRIGTVGHPLPGVELQLADDGELFVRSPSVMIGYRNRPEETADALDSGGWLHTGDIAAIDDDGRVRIIDRKKEIIINSAGKNMSPTNIEGQLKSASPMIAQAICIGESRPYNVALIVLDPDAAAMPVAAAAADERVRAAVRDAVARANRQLSRVEQIKRYEILPIDWLPDGDELTPTMKLKRTAIATKYAAEIETLYAGTDRGPTGG
jgi:long-subunit acyl-CoA synthetase (AMP-forming)